MTDPIADMLTRIRNAIAANQHEITLPHAKLKQAIAELLKDSGFIADVKVHDASIGKSLHLVITTAGSNPQITDIKRLSKPGRRLYVSADNIPHIKRGRGIVILSTSKGLMTGHQARRAGIGGELICEVV